jgi:hypothetical protein
MMKVGKWFVVAAMVVVVMLGVGAGSATADSPLVVSRPDAAQVAAAIVRVDCTSDPAALAFALASANDGDTLAIQGTCKGTFVVAHSLTLAGGGGATLDGQGAGTVLTVATGSSVQVRSLAVKGGSGSSAGGISNAGTLLLADCSVSGNAANGTEFFAGGGILNSGTLKLVNSAVTANRMSGANNGAAAIANIFPGRLTLANSTVSGNRATVQQFRNGVGGILSFAGSVTVMDSSIRANTASADAPFDTAVGGIDNASFNPDVPGTLTVINSTVSDNSATGTPSDAIGGVLNSGPGALATLRDSSVRNNTASAPGGTSVFSISVGGVENGGGRLTAIDSSVRGNSASEPDGGFLPPVGGIANFFKGTIGALTNSNIASNIPINCNFSDSACAS